MADGAKKEVGVLVDIEALKKQLKEQSEKPDPFQKTRTHVLSLGDDPRISAKAKVSAPDLRFVEFLKDGVDNPYVELNWRIPRYDINVNEIQGFNVYRRRLSKLEVKELFPRLRPFSRVGFDKVSKKIINSGKFSAERKAISQIRSSLIPDVVLNPNLSFLRGTDQARLDSTLGQTAPHSRFNFALRQRPATGLAGKFQNFFQSKRFKKVAFVDYKQFIAQEKKKFVFVKEREFVDVLFKDKKVGYGEVFEYYITSVSKDSQQSPRSNVVMVKIENTLPVRRPKLIAKQISDRSVQIRVQADSRDDVERFIFYRKSENEISFQRMAAVPNTNDTIAVVDETVQYLKKYTYRVFAENIFGTLSEPGEISFVSSGQRVTRASRSNNLKIPIILAVQDQNSDFVKVTISSNDPVVHFYELERRDLTIHERKFSVPRKIIKEEYVNEEPSYGGTGWEEHQLFVSKARPTPSGKILKSKDVLQRRSSQKEIVFLDDTVMPGHIYQYRVRGYDLFMNPSSYALSMVRVTGKKSIRTPINVQSAIVRGSPLRIKLSWDDDNLATYFSESELFEGTSDVDKKSTKILYKVQRRKAGEMVYESFPLTVNTFLVDEVPTLDAVDFTPEKTDDDIVELPNLDMSGSTTTIKSELSRPFNIPNFLKENEVYYYRIAAISELGEESNYTEEFKVSTLPDLSDPIDFKVIVENTRVKPIRAKLTWGTDSTKSRADKFVIEKKFDNLYDTFQVIGEAYLYDDFFDINIELGKTYIYRIKAIDGLGRESAFFEARLTT
jgi:hypothetical protein